MNKKAIIVFIIFAVISTLFIVFSGNIYNYLYENYDKSVLNSNYLYGEAVGERGKRELIRILIFNPCKSQLIQQRPVFYGLIGQPFG